VLIAEDDAISRRLLEAHLRRAGYEVVSTSDGGEAWHALTALGGPRLAVLDWMMPVVDGMEICRKLREAGFCSVYVILLTARGRKEDVIAGLESGANDYVTKPFDPSELRSRVAVGRRLVELHEALQTKVAELEASAAEVRTLRGLLPICMHCKKVRDDKHAWHRLETYVEEHSEATFTHSLCTDCLTQHYPDYRGSQKG
jgi:DNA-binding response OmpR family regulator